MDYKEICRAAKAALDEKMGEKIRILDIKNISSIADGFVLATGSSISQLRAMSDNVEEKLAKIGVYVRHIEGYSEAEWILMDFGSIIVHIFKKDKREFFDLDRIWSDAEEII